MSAVDQTQLQLVDFYVWHDITVAPTAYHYIKGIIWKKILKEKDIPKIENIIFNIFNYL